MRRGWFQSLRRRGLPAGAILDLDSRYVETSGSSVTQWTDRSGSGNHATPPGTAPSVEVDVFGALPGVRFGAVSADTRLEIASALRTGNEPVHMFVVYKPHADIGTAGLPLLWIGGVGTTGSYIGLVCRRGPPDETWGDPALQSGNEGGGYGFDIIGKGNARATGASILGEGFFDGSTAGASYNGLEPETVTGKTLRIESDPTVIGNRTGGSSSTDFIGHIARVIVYPRRLSDSERQRANEHLMALYGITP